MDAENKAKEILFSYQLLIPNDKVKALQAFNICLNHIFESVEEDVRPYWNAVMTSGNDFHRKNYKKD